MRKLIVFIVGIVSISLIVYAQERTSKNWSVIDPGSGTTTIKVANVAQRIALKHVLLTVQNACNLYFGYGPDNDLTKLTGNLHFGANGGWDTTSGPALWLITPAGQDLKVWFSNDPGSDMLVETSE